MLVTRERSTIENTWRPGSLGLETRSIVHNIQVGLQEVPCRAIWPRERAPWHCAHAELCAAAPASQGEPAAVGQAGQGGRPSAHSLTGSRQAKLQLQAPLTAAASSRIFPTSCVTHRRMESSEWPCLS